MTGDSDASVRYVIGVRTRRNGPVMWCDPGELEPQLAQRLVIETERGERVARVAVGLTAVPSGVPVSPLRVVRLAEGTSESTADVSDPRIGAAEHRRRHAPPPVSPTRIARFINRLLAVRQCHPGATPPLADLGQAFPGDEPDDSTGG